MNDEQADEPRGQEAGRAEEATDGQESRKDDGAMTSWQPGDRIALEYTDDPHTRLRPGDQGTVTRWDPAQAQFSDCSASFDASELRFYVEDMPVTLSSRRGLA